MKKVLIMVALGLGLVCQSADASLLTFLIGDQDDLGGRVTGSSFYGDFDYRSAEELAATNGAQLTDYSEMAFGTVFGNPIFRYAYDASSILSINNATWTLAAGGIQKQNDRLYLDETFISSAFPEQGAYGFGLIDFSIPNTSFADLLDGNADFRVNLNSDDFGEPAVFDYAKLVLDVELKENEDNPVVPEPATMVLFGTGLLGAYIKRRKQ